METYEVEIIEVSDRRECRLNGEPSNPAAGGIVTRPVTIRFRTFPGREGIRVGQDYTLYVPEPYSDEALTTTIRQFVESRPISPVSPVLQIQVEGGTVSA